MARESMGVSCRWEWIYALRMGHNVFVTQVLAWVGIVGLRVCSMTSLGMADHMATAMAKRLMFAMSVRACLETATV